MKRQNGRFSETTKRLKEKTQQQGRAEWALPGDETTMDVAMIRMVPV